MVQERSRARKAPAPASRRPAAPRSPRVKAKHERRRDQVLHAALLAFRDRGYHDTTLDDIARRLGVRKTALYHYFPDKEAILYACHQESLAELARILAEAKKLPSAAGQLRHVVKEHVRVMVETLEGSPLAFEVAAMSPARQREVIAARDLYEHALRRMIDRGIKERSFRKVDSKIAVFAILGAINWIARWYKPEGRLHAPELGAQFADHLVGGLARAGGSV